MPIYDYICGSCGRRTEVIHGVHAIGPETCPECGGGPMRKAVHPPAIHFKGTGWAKKERASSGSAPTRDQPAQPSEPSGTAPAPASSAPATESGASREPADPAPAKPTGAPSRAGED